MQGAWAASLSIKTVLTPVIGVWTHLMPLITFTCISLQLAMFKRQESKHEVVRKGIRWLSRQHQNPYPMAILLESPELGKHLRAHG